MNVYRKERIVLIQLLERELHLLTMQDTSNNVVMPIVNPDDELEKPVIGSTVDEETIGKATEKNVEGSVGNYSIKYKLYKSTASKDQNTNQITYSDYSEITGDTYLKKSDKLKVTATINAPIANVIDISNNITKLTSETAPTLSLKNGDTVIATIAPKTVSNVTTSSTETTFTYEYNITEETTSNEKINKVLLNKVGTLYVVGTTSQITDSNFGEAETSDLLFDNQAPDVITNMYVEQPLETGRYTAGKEILIKVTTNERIYGNYVLPELRVRFSKSGIGKYISSKDANVGYAKVKSAEIKIDGTTEWIYSYIVQEGDEGEVIAEFTKGTIMDRAGNTTYLQDKYATSKIKSDDLLVKEFGDNFKINGIKLYKKNQDNEFVEIDSKRYQTTDIYVEVEFDDTLYVKSENNNELAEIVSNEKAPKLFLNDNIATEVYSVNKKIDNNGKISNNTENNTVLYQYKKNTLDMVTMVDYITLKNENTKLYYGNSTIALQNGIDSDKKYQMDIDDIYLDPLGQYSENAPKRIYADTTLPTVNITAFKVDSLPTGNTAVKGEKIENGITNADIIRYRFRFSENVIGFTEDDVTVNFGTKSTVGLKKVNDKIYDLYVETNVEKGNTKDVQVIVEQDAVQDLVYQGNVRRENTVTVDKKAPILENYSVKQENGKIIVEATYDETISKTIENPLEIKFGDTAGFGGNVETEISENKVIYTYTISGSDNGKASIKLVDKVTDIVGNTSDPINAVIENDITVVKNVIRIGNDEYGFSFTDFSNRHYYKEGDVVTVIKDGVTYKHTVSGVYADNTHMKYMKLTEPGDGQGNVGNAEFSATQKANYINIEAANIYFDTTAPTLTVEADVEDKKDGSYTTGDEIIIKATASELLQESNEKPEINVSFSVSGLGKYNYQGENATTGNAKYVETVTTDNKTQYIYKYVVQNGDEGKVSLTYASANRTITDIAGNTTQLKGFTDQPVSGEVELEKDDSNITYRLYKGNTIIDRFGTNTIFKAGDIIKVEAEIGSALYNTISTDGNINVSAIRVPKLNIKIDNSDSNKITIDNSAPDNNANKIETSVTNNGENGKTIVTYIYTIKSTDKDGKLTSLEFVSRGNMYISSTERLSTFRNLNLQNANLYIFKNTSTTFESGNITVDTNAPIVTITNNADKNPTNQDPITYTFKWNEEVEGFTADDIEVNGGTIEEFNTVENKKEYTAKVKTSVAGGDVSELNVAVKQNAVRDIAGFENAREENSITIDKKAPTAEITADKENIDEIINYTINWSESVNGFETEDITVTNGTVKEFKKVENSEDKKYTLKVKSTNRNDLEVVIKENACTDNAGNTNMSAKHLINVRPTVIITALPREYDFDLDGDVDIEDVTYLQIYVEGNRSVLSQDVQEKIALFGDIDCDGKIAKSDYVELQKIIAELNNSRPINTNEVIYLFTWSEKVENFNVNNIIVNGGTKGTLSEPIFNNEYGTYTYIMRVTNNIPTGSVGEIKVSVEQDSVRDVLGNGNIRAENIFVVDKKAPTAEITADKDYVKKDDTITYTINWSEDVKGFIENSLKVTNGQITEFTKESANKYIVKVKSTTGNDITFEIKENVCKDYAENANRECKHRIAVIPTVGITTNTTNPTKENEITYTFTWSEEVNGFAEDDIIVPEDAIKSDWTKVNDTKYTLKVNYNSVIPNGNQGEVTVAVKENGVQDNDGNGNAYTNNTLKIDRIAPILISLEAYGDSNIKVNEVDTVKQYYKAGDTVTVIATFSENIEESTAPTLNLQFSESGNAKGNVMTIVPFSGNKIRYIYEIVDEDNGTLSVKGFSGTVKDTAGNETIVTKRALDGETIIADTKAPTLVSLTAIAPEFEYSNLVNGEPNDSIRYGVQSKNRENNTITIIAQYSENVYNLNGSTIKKVTSSNAPTLKLKFGNSTERTATFQKVEGDKLYYTYNIATGDNGNLSITTISGTVSDLAGNTYKTNTNTSLPGLIEYIGNTKLEGNDHIVADTTKSTYDVSVIEKIDKDDEGKTITGNKVGNVEYFRMGSTIKIEVTSTNEYVYNNTNKELDCYNDVKIPENIALKFGTNSSKGQLEYKGTKYENNKTIFTFEYTVGDMDNGKLTVIVPKNFGYDIALNGNDLKSVTFDNIVADTERPYIAENTDRTSKFEITSTTTSITATGIFSEQLYVKDANNHLSKLTSSSDAPTMGVIANGKLVKTATASVSTENGMTKLVYTASTVSPEVIDGDISVNIIDGTLYDVAGNEWSLDIKSDTTSPKFSEIQVLTEDGYYNKDKTLDFVVKFVEQTKLTDVPKLTIRIGSGEDAKLIELKGTVIEDDQLNTSLVKVARYSYTIVDENGPLTIVSLKGTASDGVRPSNINEEYTTSNDKIRDYKNNKYINTQEAKVIVDTIAPTAVITSDVERTNKNKVTYTITWSEPVYNFTISDVNVVNGIKGTFTKVNDKVYILEVHTANEGRQIISIPTNTCEDIAGNKNTERAVYNKVVIDYTKPEVRAKVNGGKYVIDIDKKKSILKETIVVTEELAEFKYAWSTLKQTPSTGWISLNASDIGINSDIPINYEADSAATYYLHIEVTDLAGNKYTGVTNGFIVSNDLITITPNVETITNNDVIATISYGTGTTGLTKNRKAGVQGKTQSADPTKVILTENGVVYAEATDINGNKVYATLAVTNIDKTVPVIEATLGNKAITVTSKDTDIAKYIVTTTADVPEVSAEGWQNWGETNTKTVETDGTYYVWAIDKAGNISKAQVIVVDTTAPTANISYVTNDDGTVTATITLSDGRVTNNEGKTTYVFTKNGEFTFEFVDEVGNKGTAVARVTTIPEKEEPQPEPTPAPEDTKAPVIEANVYNDVITILSEDNDIDKYIVTTNMTVPNKNDSRWQKANVFTGIPDGTYYAWAIDKSENISAYREVIVNTRNPEVVVDVQANNSTIKKYTENGMKYIIVSPTVSLNELKEKITVQNGDSSKISIANLNEDGKLKTHSYINYDRNTVFTIVVLGDVNSDGEVTFSDVFGANSIRGVEARQLVPVRLAADINLDGQVSFSEVLAINSIRTK